MQTLGCYLLFKDPNTVWCKLSLGLGGNRVLTRGAPTRWLLVVKMTPLLVQSQSSVTSEDCKNQR